MSDRSGRQTGRQTYKQTDVLTYRHKYRQTDKQTGRKTDRQAHTFKQTIRNLAVADREPERHAKILKDRTYMQQTDKQKKGR
jgi:hypothetical protein